MLDLHETFEKFGDEHHKFDRVVLVKYRLHSRPDICAFLLLDQLVPEPGQDMVTYASHDEIFLGIDCDELSKVATEDDILMLARCGVRYDEENDSLCMFV